MPASGYKRVLTRITAFALGVGLSLCPAIAAGGGGGSGSSGSGGGGSASTIRKQTDLTTCPKGQVWSIKKKACLRSQSDLFTDEDLTDYAYSLAKADRYDEALATLDTLTGPPTPKTLNYRGYATRKLGRTDEGIGYYLKSIAMDPHYAQVREYLGEAYVIKGKLDLAKDQLTAIEGICGGTECEEYEDLAHAIETGGA